MRKITLGASLGQKSISRRWFINSLCVMVALLVVFISILAFTFKSNVYSSLQQIITGRSEELINVLSTTAGSDFSTVSRSYIETFPDKNDMEIMSISSSGHVIVSSTGFLPRSQPFMPDYDSAIISENDFGYWAGTSDTGESVMAVTRVFRNNYGEIEGSLRYIISLEEADDQIMVIVLALIVVGVIIALIITLSGLYFVKSIITPVKKLTVSAQKISSGDFGVRIEKKDDDEIGQLIDNINLMAEELGNAEQMKNDFISSVSHELRTPLTAIKGWAETLQGGEQDKETAEKGMAVIIKEAQRLSGIVEELLDFSRLQSGRLNLVLKKTDLLAELDESVFMFTERASAEKKNLVYDEATMFPPVLADVNRLKQVFINIIDNALKYTDEGGTITITTAREDDFIHVIVQDTGCGIPEEHLPHIKKKFYKANQIVRGSGIGLAVADDIVDMHGGKLTVESEEGVGTKITIEMPIYTN